MSDRHEPDQTEDDGTRRLDGPDSRCAAALDAATDAALRAGNLLRAELARPGGPRGEIGSCPADREAEILIRDALDAYAPEFGIIGEEIRERNRRPRDPEGHVWLVDPNDGTARMQQGWRGAAVSIGLVRDGRPVLGVVFAYAADAGRGDLLRWAEGLPFQRNGVAVGPRDWAAPTADDTVLLSPAADRKPGANLRACAPARYRTVASVAYRLALVAAGEGIAAVSWGGPTDYDVAAGQALLRAVGGELLRFDGTPVTYDPDGHAVVQEFVGGHPAVARLLVQRPWPVSGATAAQRRRHEELASARRGPGRRADTPVVTADRTALMEVLARLGPVTPVPGEHITDPGLLDRGHGTLVGQLSGDSLGSLVEFRTPASISAQYGERGPTRLADGGTFDTIAGQPTDDSELALVLARTVVLEQRYDPEQVARGYAAWLASGPFDQGTTMTNACRAAVDAAAAGRSASEAARRAALGYAESQANGALMRVSPLALYAHRFRDEQIADLARSDASLSHAHPVCQDANAVFCIAVAAAVRDGLAGPDVHAYALEWARRQPVHDLVTECIHAAASAPPADPTQHQGWVLLALQNALFQVGHAADPESGIVDTVRRGGDTDTNAAIAGALLGAVHGAAAFPRQWRDRIDSCRTPAQDPSEAEVPGGGGPGSGGAGSGGAGSGGAGVGGAGVGGAGVGGPAHPRPAAFWPVDSEALAERLLFLGRTVSRAAAGVL